MIYKILTDHKNEVKILKPLELAKYRRYIRILSESTSLKMFSFCGQKYDINVLKGCLFNILLNRDPNCICLKRDVGRVFFLFFVVQNFFKKIALCPYVSKLYATYKSYQICEKFCRR